MSPGGETCVNQHGGAPGVEPPLVMETPEEMGGQDAALPVLAVVPPPAPAPPPVAPEAPRTLLRPPVRVGGLIFGGQVATLPPPKGVVPPKRIKIVITNADGSEQEVGPEELE
jgi:hypothetical protein